MDDHQEQYDRRVADYWDRNTDAPYQGQTYWLANPLVAARFNRRAVGGRDYDSWVNFCVRHYLGDKPVERILTIGCGDGALDRHLASLNAARVIDGIDIAPNRIEIKPIAFDLRQLRFRGEMRQSGGLVSLRGDFDPFDLERRCRLPRVIGERFGALFVNFSVWIEE